MTRIVPTLASLFLVASGAALAADLTGEVQGVDRQKRTIQVTMPGDCICNAVTYEVPTAVDMGWLSPGVMVTISYTTANNVNTVTKLSK
jgi:hypothetical protein